MNQTGYLSKCIKNIGNKSASLSRLLGTSDSLHFPMNVSKLGMAHNRLQMRFEQCLQSRSELAQLLPQASKQDSIASKANGRKKAQDTTTKSRPWAQPWPPSFTLTTNFRNIHQLTRSEKAEKKIDLIRYSICKYSRWHS